MSDQQAPYYQQLKPTQVYVLHTLNNDGERGECLEEYKELEKLKFISFDENKHKPFLDRFKLTGLGKQVLENYIEYVPLQKQIGDWSQVTFDHATITDIRERSARFNEESAELLQAAGYTFEDYCAVGLYVWSRPKGELHQEAGGVMVTFSILCNALGLSWIECGKQELKRIWGKVPAIRAKHNNRPNKTYPLPGAIE